MTVFSEIAALAGDDGLEFDAVGPKGQIMRENALYEGCHLSRLAKLNGVRNPLSMDSGFGDAITRSAEAIDCKKASYALSSVAKPKSATSC